jgi:hypothetical protein
LRVRGLVTRDVADRGAGLEAFGLRHRGLHDADAPRCTGAAWRRRSPGGARRSRSRRARIAAGHASSRASRRRTARPIPPPTASSANDTRYCPPTSGGLEQHREVGRGLHGEQPRHAEQCAAEPNSPSVHTAANTTGAIAPAGRSIA